MKRILAYPQVYNLYQNMIGVDKFYSVFVKNIILSEKVENILDLACGTARMLKFLDANVGYTGVDISERYIKYNQKNAVNLKHKFFIADICEFANFGNDFDTIV